MYEKDFIMRLIQQFMRMAARLMGLRETGQFKDLDEEIRLAYDSILKTDYEHVMGFSKEDWNTFMKERQPEEWEMAGMLLMIEGEALNDQGRKKEALEKMSVALMLLEESEKAQKNYSLDRAGYITKLQAFIEQDT